MNTVTLQALAAFPAQLEAHYGAFPAELVHWKPDSWAGVPSEPLTAIEQVCHVRDVEVDGYHLRIARALNEASPTLSCTTCAVTISSTSPDCSGCWASSRAS